MIFTASVSIQSLIFSSLLSGTPYDYVEFLRLWHPIRDYVTAELNADGELEIVVDGPLFSVVIPVVTSESGKTS